MRRVVSHQERTDHANDTLRALVRILARAAASEALAATPQTEDKAHRSSLPSEGNDRAK
jgi:hypothetical protein|tara:strand:- start:340 stop:516 length:177 start_codon:yes stop_codon:yes gene_type:complete